MSFCQRIRVSTLLDGLLGDETNMGYEVSSMMNVKWNKNILFFY